MKIFLFLDHYEKFYAENLVTLDSGCASQINKIFLKHLFDLTFYQKSTKKDSLCDAWIVKSYINN